MNKEEEALQEKQVNYVRVKEIPENVEETRTVTFVASTDDVDRHGTVVNQERWELDAFNLNPIIGYQHDVYGGGMCNKADPDDVIGRGAARVVDLPKRDSEPQRKQLEVDITFEPKSVNEKADKVFRKVLAGTLNTVSVGFLPIGDGRYGRPTEDGVEDKDIYFFDGQELLEISVVNIPANANALRKGFRNSTAEAIRILKRELGAEFSYSDIEKLTVGNIIKFLEKGEIPGKHTDTEEESEEQEEAVENNSENNSNNLQLKKKRLILREQQSKSNNLQL